MPIEELSIEVESKSAYVPSGIWYFSGYTSDHALLIERDVSVRASVSVCQQHATSKFTYRHIE